MTAEIKFLAEDAEALRRALGYAQEHARREAVYWGDDGDEDDVVESWQDDLAAFKRLEAELDAQLPPGASE